MWSISLNILSLIFRRDRVRTGLKKPSMCTL
nr:MAG TPA: hypothetical protein [Caudoviricetes sp.]